MILTKSQMISDIIVISSILGEGNKYSASELELKDDYSIDYILYTLKSRNRRGNLKNLLRIKRSEILSGK